MEDSEWLYKIKQLIWPKECIRCRETEALEQDSIRVHTIRFHQQQDKNDYLIVGGVLDNICNSGCLTCDENHSTKIGSLTSKTYPIIDNTNCFWQLPVNRIVKLDINGGEPSASKNYLNVLQNLPPNVKEVRINTNCSSIIDEIEHLIKRGIKVVVTVSLDGIEETHDLVRWPIKWDKFYNNLIVYKNMPGVELNTWTTVSALNIHNFTAIQQFVTTNQINHSYAFLHDPDPISIKYTNTLTSPYKSLFPDIVAVDKDNQIELDEFIKKQKELRGL
jgi:sulfatase maturation enzyme AslB (radical SAM superfamily)